MELRIFRDLWRRFNRNGKDWKQSFAKFMADADLGPDEFAELCVESGRTLPLTIELIARFAYINGRQVQPAVKALCEKFVGEGKKFSRDKLYEAIMSAPHMHESWRAWMLAAAGFGGRPEG